MVLRRRKKKSVSKAIIQYWVVVISCMCVFLCIGWSWENLEIWKKGQFFQRKGRSQKNVQKKAAIDLPDPSKFIWKRENILCEEACNITYFIQRGEVLGHVRLVDYLGHCTFTTPHSIWIVFDLQWASKKGESATRIRQFCRVFGHVTKFDVRVKVLVHQNLGRFVVSWKGMW